MPFDPNSPSVAKGHLLATWVITQLSNLTSTSQVNSDILLDIANLDATLDTVVASVGS